jgi:hypothetical protein
MTDDKTYVAERSEGECGNCAFTDEDCLRVPCIPGQHLQDGDKLPHHVIWIEKVPA